MLNTDVLVLNSGFIPIRIATARDAICLLTADKAISVIDSTESVRSPSISMKIPSVISILGYNELPKKKVIFSKLNIIYRDDMICQFCNKRFSIRDLTVDHVIPGSRWEALTGKSLRTGYSSWENMVCACKWCNNKKGNKLIKELGWTLLEKPVEPKYMPHIILSYDKAIKKGWLPFCGFNVKLLKLVA
jgi:5-methylcytosine-specific restriction endonuclease McrA